MRANHAIGIVGMVVGLAAAGTAAFVFTNAKDRNVTLADAMSTSEQRCREEVSKVGNYIPKSGNLVEVVLNDPQDPRAAMSDVTAVLVMCPHRRFVDACFGTLCGPDGRPSEMRAVITLSR